VPVDVRGRVGDAAPVVVRAAARAARVARVLPRELPRRARVERAPARRVQRHLVRVRVAHALPRRVSVNEYRTATRAPTSIISISPPLGQLGPTVQYAGHTVGPCGMAKMSLIQAH
jgi:hypothetical protein